MFYSIKILMSLASDFSSTWVIQIPRHQQANWLFCGSWLGFPGVSAQWDTSDTLSQPGGIFAKCPKLPPLFHLNLEEQLVYWIFLTWSLRLIPATI